MNTDRVDGQPDEQWFIELEGNVRGPITSELLNRLVSGGGLLLSDRLRLGEDGDWLTAGSIPGLFGVDHGAARVGWYCRIRGRVRGPLTLEQLSKRFEDGKFDPRSTVRIGTESPWFPASEIEGLLGQEIVADVASDLLKAAQRRHFASTSTTPSRPQSGIGRLVRPVAAVVGNVWEAVAGVGSGLTRKPQRRPVTPVKKRPSRPRIGMGDVVRPVMALPAALWEAGSDLLSRLHLDLRIVAAVLGMIAVATAATLFFANRVTEEQVYHSYVSIWSELKQLRESSATDTQWDEFSGRTTAALEPMLEWLEGSASVERPARKHLLWAGKDHLANMFTDARQEPSHSEEQFALHLEEVTRILNLPAQ